MTEHLCCVCGYRERHGVIFGRVIAHGDVAFEKEFACERCIIGTPELWFDFKIPTVDGYNCPLTRWIQKKKRNF